MKLSHPFLKSPPVVSHSGLYLHGRKILPPSKDTSKSSVPQMAANDSCTIRCQATPQFSEKKKVGNGNIKNIQNTRFHKLIWHDFYTETEFLGKKKRASLPVDILKTYSVFHVSPTSPKLVKARMPQKVLTFPLSPLSLRRPSLLVVVAGAT